MRNQSARRLGYSSLTGILSVPSYVGNGIGYGIGLYSGRRKPAPVEIDADVPVASASRPVIVPRRSWLVTTARRLALAPLLVLGLVAEEEKVAVPLFRGFEESSGAPLSKVCVCSLCAFL